MNAALGQALAIVSPVPQTTRNRILGVVHRPGVEILLLDTPGIHKPHSRLGRSLNRTAREATGEADVVVYVTAAGPRGKTGVHPGDATLLTDVGKDVPTILVVNKIDQVKDKSVLLPLLQDISALRDFAAVVPISALKEDGIDIVLSEISKLLPEKPRRFEEDEITDRPVRFFAGEFVREQILLSTKEEIPHRAAVEITGFDEKGPTVRIEATIHVEREGQKRILIGAGGEKLKAIGSAARPRIEELLGKKVFLSLWVKVSPDWTESEQSLNDLGYGKEP